MSKPNVDELVVVIRGLAKTYPDAVYASPDSGTPGDGSLSGCCYYNRGAVINGPCESGCIVGHALRRLSVEVPERWDDEDASTLIYRLELTGYEGIGSLWCRTVQAAQDRGATWSAAVACADAKYHAEVST